ncbi:Trigger factor [Metamycoplasma alkalescens]|uniref:peptidylprolyl isomerase n=1 Tax=Metamycoplasma alkalescens TaxID=45363 RepID=A0A3B0P0S2_9BACT|nr:Trigger factor [Metamycoplasma alkalescens]
MVIGSNQFIPGFEEKMIGLKKGETKDLHLTFPKEYHAKNLAGKDVIFKVTIHNIKTPNYPEINEQFLQEIKINPLVKTPADFDKYLEITALKNKLQKNKTNFINSAIEEITSNSKVEMSEIIVDQTANGYYRDFLTQIKQRGVSEKEYIEFSKTTKDEILDLYKKEATKNLIKSYIYGKIVDEEKLHISDEEYDKRIKQLADLYGLKEDQIKTFVPFKNFEQEKLADRIFDKLAQLNDPENLKKYHEIQKEVDDYHSEIEKILVAEAKKKSAQEKVNKEK